MSPVICFVILAEAVVPDDWIKVSFSVDNSSIPNFRDGSQRHRDGNTNSSGFGKQIAFGMIAYPGQFRSMASLSFSEDYWTHQCGAVLVSGSVHILVVCSHIFIFFSVKYVG